MAVDLLDKNDEKLNPGQTDIDRKVAASQQLAGMEQAPGSLPMDNFERSFANDTAEDPTDTPTDQADSVRDSEANPSTPPTESEKKEPKQSDSDKSKNDSGGKWQAGANFLKSKGPMGFIVLIFITGCAGLISLLTPGLALVQIKEAIFDDLQDSLASMDIRNQHIMRAKLNGATKGICTKHITFRCKYTTFSKREINQMRKQGFRFEPDLDTAEGLKDAKRLGGRYKITTLIPPTNTPDVIRAGPITGSYENGKPVYRIGDRKVTKNSGIGGMNKYTYVDGPDKGKTVSVQLSPQETAKLNSFHNTKPPETRVDASNFKSIYKDNVAFRSLMNKAWSPRWSGIRDKAAQAVFSKAKVTLKRTFGGGEKEMKEQLDSAAKEGTETKRTIKKDKDGYYTDENGKRIKDSNGVDIKVSDANDEKLLKADERTSMFKKPSALGSMLSSGLRGANLFTGTQETACALLSMTEKASVAAKNIKYLQYLRYFSVFATTADLIKIGSATPEAVGTLMDIITHVDTRDKIVGNGDIGIGNDGNLLDNFKNLGDNPSNNTSYNIEADTPNPDKNKSAMDSAGIKAAMYGQFTSLNTREQQYTLAGGLAGTLLAITNLIRTYSKNAGMNLSRNSCKVYENPLVQAGGLLLSVGAIFASGGSAAFIQGVKAAAFAIATTFVMNFIAAQIEAILTGKSVNSDTKGIDAGNALFAGGAAMLGSLASSRGLKPLSTKKEISESMRIAYEAKNQYNEVARYDARDEPLNAYNQFSFLGSIVWKINPWLVKTQTNVASLLSAPTMLLSTAVGSLSPTAGAAPVSDTNRFTNYTNDPTYSEVNMQTADFFGNIRYGLDETQLNADSEKVYQWMVDARQINPDTGEPAKDAAAAEALASPNPTKQQVSAILKPSSYDDDQIAVSDDDDVAIPSVMSAAASVSLEAASPVSNTVMTTGTSMPVLSNSPQYIKDPLKDVRSYAHWVRFCRTGDESGRKVAFGDMDALDGSIFTGLDLKDAYMSDGRECFTSNRCSENQDPNGLALDEYSNNANEEQNIKGDEIVKKRCYPQQYDIYPVMYASKGVVDSRDEEEQSDGAQTSSSNGQFVTGDAKDLARKVANNPNIQFVNPATKTALEQFADTGQATNSCGQSFGIDPMLSGIMLGVSGKYKMYVNNFGFQSDRSFCDTGQHPAGKAIDLNGIEKIGGGGTGGGKTNWGSLTYSSDEVNLITDFATDWMDGLASGGHAGNGRSGQIGCGGYNLLNKRKPAWQGADGNLHFSDSCDHLHIDVGNR